ncbi:MAG: NAD-dependent epimerase/dehydratase family protein [Bacteroidetes bacterium]|nr:NAD-dependent epimerase/dehydratase family protein [Bacteroidota bacterium]
MKVFVTGATGLLGNNIIRELVSRNIEVQVLIHKNSNSVCFENLPVVIKYGNICDYDSILDAAKGCEIIIHSAALTKMNAANETYQKVNVEGTRNILNVAESLKIKRLIYVSTSNVFGPGSKENPGNELSPYAFSNFNSGYIKSKFDAQQLVNLRNN